MKLKINNKDFLFFNNFAIGLSLDTVASTFSFSVRFDPDNESHKVLFKPLSYNQVKLYTDDNKLLLTGVLVNHNFTSTGQPQLVKVSGYSLGGILEDVNIPYTDYPLESIKRSLKDIASKLLSSFNLTMVIDSSAERDMNLIYDKTVASPGESIKSYLSKLAAQRNIILSHNEKGDIVFTKPSFSGKPKFSFNKTNSISMSLSVKGQGLHSSIWVLRQPSKDNNGLTPVDKIDNNLVGVFRSGVKVLSSGTDTDTAKAVKNVLASEMKNIGLTINLKDDLGIFPGDIVDVENNELFLYKKTKFVVSKVSISKNVDKTPTSLSLVLPEVYTGNSPQKIFDK